MLSKKIKIKDIEKFLSENPNFFIEQPQILEGLKFPSLKKNNGFTDTKFRKLMSSKTFKQTYEYDKLIYKWFNEKNKQ